MFGRNKELEERFEVTYSQSGRQIFKILRDKKTGINYLYTTFGYSGGVTPLLDTNGEPIITK